MTAHQFFHDTFGLNLGHYLDGMLSTALGKPCLDPFKFDEWLHKKYGRYEETEKSMQSLLIAKYGARVEEQVRKLILGEYDVKETN